MHRFFVNDAGVQEMRARLDEVGGQAVLGRQAL